MQKYRAVKKLIIYLFTYVFVFVLLIRLVR